MYERFDRRQKRFVDFSDRKLRQRFGNAWQKHIRLRRAAAAAARMKLVAGVLEISPKRRIQLHRRFSQVYYATK